MVTRAQLYKLAPEARSDIVNAIVKNWQFAVDAGLTTPQRIRPFFANVCTETGGMTILAENMNYTAERAHAVWPERFPTVQSAVPYSGRPRPLANHVYGGRMGNKPEPSDDGYNYRGGGLMQATGADEYKIVGHLDDPDTLRIDPVEGFKSAVTLWKHYKLNDLADAGKITKIRQVINGGDNGMQDMQKYYTTACTIWHDGVDLSTESRSEELDQVEMIKQAQTKLIALGYTEVGTVDGEIGAYTKAAILAFRHDNGLPPGDVDDALLDALDVAKPRQVQRDPVTPVADVSNNVPEVLAHVYNKVLAGIVSFFSFLGLVIEGVISNFEEAEHQFNHFKPYFPNVPPWGWFGLIMVTALTIFLLAQHGETTGVKAFRSGARR